MFKFKRNTRNLRSHNDNLVLSIPITKKKTFADRSLSVNGAVLWNELPLNIRQSKDIDTFKNLLKTYYFRRIYQ